MIVVKLMGGMGNQMFQYALGRSISLRYGQELKLDLSFLKDTNRDEDFVMRDFDLDIFNINASIFTPQDKLHNAVLLRENSSCDYIPGLLQQCDEYSGHDFYLEGYFQKHQYVDEIRETLLQEFSLKEDIQEDSIELASQIASANSVCINIRRADFVHNEKNAPFHGFYGQDYVKAAIPYILEKNDNPHFFVFSDDIEWCEKNIVTGYDTTFVGHDHKGKKFGQYMKLMSMCKDFIIPNSSFAWWAAWMNSGSPTVVTPLKWFQADHVNTEDLRPNSWVKLGVDCE